jgi:hypothetical protein
VSAHRFPGAALVARLDVPEDLSVIVVDLSPERLVAFAPTRSSLMYATGVSTSRIAL